MERVAIRVRPLRAGDEPEVVALIADFRVSLAELRGERRQRDLAAAGDELAGYLARGYPVYAAEAESGRLAGYLVCRVEGDVLWAESLYVAPEFRRQGVGSSLYAEAERLARDLGADTLYNWVDPNNRAIIAFLRRRGYTVLNLLELRRPYPGEGLPRRIVVGENEFGCC